MWSEDPDLDLLRLVADLTEARTSGTDAIAQAKYEADLAAKRNAYRTSKGPYFGLDHELRVLRDAGLIAVDVGMAEFHPPGTPAPGPGEYYVDLTDAGREALRQH